MTDRERLVEILQDAEDCLDFETMADFLIDNGVTVLPCKVGDKIYVIPSKANWRINNMYESMKENNRIYEQTVEEVHIYQSDYTVGSCGDLQHQPSTLFGETWFLTREEAEKALEEREEK